MVPTKMLYLQLITENKYEQLSDEKILSKFFDYTVGSLQCIISDIINKATLNHMNLNIDSTIMQVLALNQYLTGLFIKNFKILINNYILNLLKQLEITSLNEMQIAHLKQFIETCSLNTDLEEIRLLVNESDFIKT